MKFVLIFGPQAVGKMTVGHELEKITELKLFHNHMVIELLYPYFNFSPEMWRLTTLFRKEIFETFSKSDSFGMIYTRTWDLNRQEECEGIRRIFELFESRGAEIYLVELEADIEERIKRNKTPHRLEHKPTKRNIAKSEQNLIKSMEHSRLNSFPGEITRKNYIRINNTSLTAEEVATFISKKFNL